MNDRGRLSGRLLFALLLALVMLPGMRLLLSGPGRVLGQPSLDGPWFFYCYNEFAASAWAGGELPLWNPYIMMGIPFLAEGQAALFHPLSALFLLLDTIAAFNLFVLLSTAAAAAGFWGYLRAAGLKIWPCFLGAAAWSLSSVMIAPMYAGHLNRFPALAGLPLLLMCWERHRSSGRAGWLAGFAVIYTTVIFAGFPQLLYLFSIFIIGYVSLQSLAAGRGPVLRRLKPLLWLAAAMAVGVVLAAPQLLPSLDFTPETFRAEASFEFSSSFSFPPENLLTLVCPRFFGPVAAGEAAQYWGLNYFWEMWLYIGIAPLILATAGLFRARREFAVPLGVSVAAFTILGLGKYTPVFRFFYDYVPAYSLFRGPSKHMFITGFCLAALAGHGWNWLFSIEQPYRCWPARDRRTRTAALVATALLILILTGALTVLKPFQTGKGSVWSLTVAEHLAHPESRTRPLDPNDPVAAAATGDLAMQQLARAFVLLAATASLVLLVSLNVSGKWRRIAAAVLVLTDLTAFAWPFHATFAAEQIAYPAPFMEVLAQSPTPPRIHDFTGPPNVAMTERVSSISGYTGSALRRYNDFFNLSQNLLRGASQAYSIIDSLPPLYQMLALEYVILPQQALNPGMRTVAQAGDIALVAADGSFPRVFLAPDIERVSGYEPALGRVLHAGPGLLQRPVIEDYSGPYNPAPLAASETAAITSFQLNKLLIDTKTLQTRLLVVNEMYYKDWRAEVDGAPTDIYPVNVLFRGVFVPPGEHQVVLYCAAPAFVAGSVISAVSLVALVCGLIVTLAKRRRPHLPTA